MVGVKVPMGGSLVMMCLGAKAGWVGKRMGLSKGAQTGAVDVVVDLGGCLFLTDSTVSKTTVNHN